jgi:hypothetical protein
MIIYTTSITITSAVSIIELAIKFVLLNFVGTTDGAIVVVIVSEAAVVVLRAFVVVVRAAIVVVLPIAGHKISKPPVGHEIYPL